MSLGWWGGAVCIAPLGPHTRPINRKECAKIRESGRAWPALELKLRLISLPCMHGGDGPCNNLKFCCCHPVLSYGAVCVSVGRTKAFDISANRVVCFRCVS